MTQNDFGDIANLDGSLSATNLVDAMNETISIANLLLVLELKIHHQHNNLFQVVIY